jgi:hypothetical protein
MRIKTGLSDIPKKQWELCTVLNVHPQSYTCDVRGDSGRMFVGIPFPAHSRDASGLAGEVNVPRRGERFALHYGLAEPYLAYAAPPLFRGQAPVEHRVNYGASGDGGLDSVYAEEGAANYRGGLPPDVQPGDWLRLATKGNLLGVLESGTTILKASELAQVIAHRTRDLLQLVGRNMDVVTDFGEIKFKNEAGHVSMSLKGGSQQATQTGYGQEHFTIHADLGHAGDLVDFRITDEQGRNLARVHYGADGSITTEGHNKTEQLTGDVLSNVTGNVVEHIGEAKTTVIGGAASEEIAGAKTIAADGVAITSSAHAALAGRGRVDINAGEKLTITAGGSPTAVPGSTAFATVVTNGSWVVDVGNTAAGDLGAALSGVHIKTGVGNIVLQSTAGDIQLKTNTPDSVHIGGQLPIYHTVLFEMLEAFMQQLGLALDTHTHLFAGTPTTPPVAPPYQVARAILQLAKSKFVTIGG